MVAGTTATTGTDFTAVPATITLTIAAGATSGTADFVLTAITDILNEPDGETLTLQIVGTTPSFTSATPLPVLTITDDAPDMIDLSLSTDRVTEGDDPVTVTVTAELLGGTAAISNRLLTITVGPNTTAGGGSCGIRGLHRKSRQFDPHHPREHVQRHGQFHADGDGRYRGRVRRDPTGRWYLNSLFYVC